MLRHADLTHMSIALFVIGGLLISGSINAQQPSDVNAVKAANQAFYAALSGRDVSAMQKVWSDDPDAQNIGPRDKAFTGGSERIQNGFGNLFDNLSEFKVSMAEPRIKVVGSVAWVSGIEQAERKDKAGTSSSGTNLATNIFQKQDGRWLMVHHHASLMPQ